MSTPEVKRRGRPAKAIEESTTEPESGPDAEVLESVRPTTPPCPRCGTPLDRSTKLLRAYDMAVLRCVACRHVMIEGDVWFDVDTARAGKPPLIVSRAASLFAMNRQYEPTPDFDVDGFDAAVLSDWDDPRWTNLA